MEEEKKVKLDKYPKMSINGLLKLAATKEIYLDKYYSKDFLKQYFS